MKMFIYDACQMQYHKKDRFSINAMLSPKILAEHVAFAITMALVIEDEVFMNAKVISDRWIEVSYLTEPPPSRKTVVTKDLVNVTEAGTYIQKRLKKIYTT